MTDNPPTLTARRIAIAQTELRVALGLPPGEFPVPTFIGMVSDEIEQLRARGFADADIAGIISAATHVEVSTDDIGRHYAPPSARGRPG